MFCLIRANAFDLKVMGDGLDAVKAKMQEIKAKGFEASNVENALFGTPNYVMKC